MEHFISMGSQLKATLLDYDQKTHQRKYLIIIITVKLWDDCVFIVQMLSLFNKYFHKNKDKSMNNKFYERTLHNIYCCSLIVFLLVIFVILQLSLTILWPMKVILILFIISIINALLLKMLLLSPRSALFLLLFKLLLLLLFPFLVTLISCIRLFHLLAHLIFFLVIVLLLLVYFLLFTRNSVSVNILSHLIQQFLSVNVFSCTRLLYPARKIEQNWRCNRW